MNARTMVQYTYVLNNPTNLIDPWGLFGEPAFHDECGYAWFWDGGWVPEWALPTPEPPASPSFWHILDSVMEYFYGLTNDEIFQLVESGFLESLGFSIPSDWLDNMGSVQHADVNEMRQALAFGMAYHIYNAYASIDNTTPFDHDSWTIITSTTVRHFGMGNYGHTSTNRPQETQRFITEQVLIEQHMLDTHGIGYQDFRNRTGLSSMERSPMNERTFLSDPHLARYMTLQERKAAHSFLEECRILGRLSTYLANEFGHTPAPTTNFWGSLWRGIVDTGQATVNSVGNAVDRVRGMENDRGATLWDRVVGNINDPENITAHDLAWIAGLSFTASDMYQTSGEWVGTAFTGAVMMHASSFPVYNAMKSAAQAAQAQAVQAGQWRSTRGLMGGYRERRQA